MKYHGTVSIESEGVRELAERILELFPDPLGQDDVITIQAALAIVKGVNESLAEEKFGMKFTETITRGNA